MGNDLRAPPLTTWMIALMPVLGLTAYYYPQTQEAIGVIVFAASGFGVYRVARWAVACAKAMVRPSGQ